MLLAIDIGNSRIKLGIFDNDRLARQFSIPTDRTTDVETLSRQLSELDLSSISECVVCSVVPDLETSLSTALRAAANCQPRFITHHDVPELAIAHRPIESIGIDRVVNSYAAAALYGKPVVAVSLGTATTIDLVNIQNELVGGVIAPGIAMFPLAVRLATAKLPEVTVGDASDLSDLLQTTTQDAIRSGIYNGYIGMVSYLIQRAIETSDDDTRVVITGGGTAVIRDRLPDRAVIDGDLTLRGIALIANKMRS